MTLPIPLVDYISQRIHDAYVDDEEAQADAWKYQRSVGMILAYQDVLAFLRDGYRAEWLEAVADRIERRTAAVASFLSEPTDER